GDVLRPDTKTLIFRKPDGGDFRGRFLCKHAASACEARNTGRRERCQEAAPTKWRVHNISFLLTPAPYLSNDNSTSRHRRGHCCAAGFRLGQCPSRVKT